jgi:hypothetical protein
MTRHSSVRVPAAHAGVVVDTLLATYARKAEALAAATRGYLAEREPLAAVVDARRAVIEAESTLDTLGWQPGPRSADVEVAGPVGAVREVLYEAMVVATDLASAACHDYESARIDRRALAAAIADVAALHELFAALEETDSPDES